MLCIRHCDPQTNCSVISRSKVDLMRRGIATRKRRAKRRWWVMVDQCVCVCVCVCVFCGSNSFIRQCIHQCIHQYNELLRVSVCVCVCEGRGGRVKELHISCTHISCRHISMHTCVHEYSGVYLSRSTGSHSAQCSPPVCVCVCVRACIHDFSFCFPPLPVRAPSPVCVYVREWQKERCHPPSSCEVWLKQQNKKIKTKQ